MEERCEIKSSEICRNIQDALLHIDENLVKNFDKSCDHLDKLYSVIEIWNYEFEKDKNPAIKTMKLSFEKIDEFTKLRATLQANLEKFLDRIESVEKIYDRLLENSRKPIEKPPPVVKKVDEKMEKRIIPPENLQRCKGIEDINKRMIEQLELNDSLENFYKAMNRNNNDNNDDNNTTNNSNNSNNNKSKIDNTKNNIINNNKTKLKKLNKNMKNLEEKYANSLLFFNKKPSKIDGKFIKQKTRLTANVRHVKIDNFEINPTRATTSTTTPRLPPTTPRLTTLNQDNFSNFPTTNNNNNTSLQIGKNNEHPLKCYNILDEINNNDIKPLRSEYPRRDNIDDDSNNDNTDDNNNNSSNNSNNNTNKSYLEIILNENDKVWQSLLQTQKSKINNLINYLIDNKNDNTDDDNNDDNNNKKGDKFKQNLIVMPFNVNYNPISNGDNGDNKLGNYEKSRKKILKQKEILDNLYGKLKVRNRWINTNIEQAIEEIELKMINLLSQPFNYNNNQTNNSIGDDENKGNLQNFDDIEVEISNVLKLIEDGLKPTTKSKSNKHGDLPITIDFKQTIAYSYQECAVEYIRQVLYEKSLDNRHRIVIDERQLWMNQRHRFILKVFYFIFFLLLLICFNFNYM